MTRAADDPLPGTVLGGCRMESLIGRGGMGTVYRAQHLALDKPVAVKVLAPHLAGDREYVGRFVLEARAAARVEHPNVIHVINVAHERELYFIVMTFVEGESAEQVLRREGRLEAGRATAIVRDVAAGLGALHREGIIHRDIKPANILLGRDGTVKITDFGLARKVEQRTGFTADGAFMGTPEFVSPEQAEGREIDPRSDLYSLGVTYYQLLSGLLPFQGMSSVDVAAKHMRDVPPSLGEVLPGVDPRAAAVVHRLLQKSPEERHADADALVVDLEGILEAPAPALDSPAPPPDPVHASPTVPSPRPPPPANAVIPVAAGNVGQGLRATIFWGLAVLALALSFSAGALGAGVRGEGFLEGLLRPFQSPDDGLPARIALGALAVVALVAAFIVNRGNLRGAGHPFAGACLMGLAGIGFYVGGVHGPVAGPGGSALGASLAGLAVSRTHLGHLAFVAGWGVLTGIALGCGSESGRFARISGALGVLCSLGLVAAFAAGGAVQAIGGSLKENMGVLLVAAASVSTALLGIFMAFGSRRRGVTRVPGILLILASVVGHYLVGSLSTRGPDPAGSLLDPLAGMGEALIAHQGFVTVAALLALWSTWLLRNRGGAGRQFKGG